MKNEDSRFTRKNRMKLAFDAVYPLFRETPSTSDFVESQSNTVSVRLHDILPALSFAYEKGLLWVEDFENDQVEIPKDLSDVINVIRELQSRKPS